MSKQRKLNWTFINCRPSEILQKKTSTPIPLKRDTVKKFSKNQQSDSLVRESDVNLQVDSLTEPEQKHRSEGTTRTDTSPKQLRELHKYFYFEITSEIYTPAEFVRFLGY